MDTSNIAKYINIGQRDIDWYQGTQHVFEDLFGKEKLQLVCNLFAATSINTALKGNVTLFRRAYYEIENNLPVGRYLPNIQTQLTRVREGKELSGRKIRSFAKAMAGDKNAVVVDVWLLRAFGLDKKYVRKPKGGKGRGLARSGGLTDRQYTMIENFCRELADILGLEPRQVSSMIWAGARIDTNGDTHTRYDHFLKTKLTNLFNVI